MTSPPDKEFDEQMKMLEGYDDVKIPEAIEEGFDRVVQRAEELGKSFVTPENSPELFSSGGGDSLRELIDLVKNLPRDIVRELRSM